MSKAWPRPLGALAGIIVMVVFVLVPEGRQFAWRHDAWPHLLVVGLVSGAAGAVTGWLVVVVRNRLMVQK
jgi:ribose/xylose/arabinose/galactoside ABC-type transport system permease subunit